MINALKGIWSQLRSLLMVFSHAFRPRSSIQYPEEPGPVRSRYRGRIVLTRDPDGEERCVACNLCAVACPVDCIALQKAETEDGRWYPPSAARYSPPDRPPRRGCRQHNAL